MDKTEKKQLFRQAACSAMAGLLANEGELSDEEVKANNKESEIYIAEKAVGYAESFVEVVEKAEKNIEQKGKWK